MRICPKTSHYKLTNAFNILFVLNRHPVNLKATNLQFVPHLKDSILLLTLLKFLPKYFFLLLSMNHLKLLI